nr:MAG TPA: YsxB-like protein [Caudoviricetes sp.]
MTTVYAERDGTRYTLFANGHATGRPEVCAAISGILYALGGYIKNAEGGSTLAYDQTMESGRVAFHFNGDSAAGGAFDMAVIGLKQIEAKYPDCIRVEYQEE